jgi:hypothetical protein
MKGAAAAKACIHTQKTSVFIVLSQLSAAVTIAARQDPLRQASCCTVGRD